MKTWMMLQCLLWVFISPILAASKNACSQTAEKVATEQETLSELIQLRQDLETRFQEYCQEDFSAQVEGVANEIHRNKAIKVAFAKRRLTKLIDNKSRELASSVETYCGQCRDFLNREDKKYAYCQRCPAVCN